MIRITEMPSDFFAYPRASHVRVPGVCQSIKYFNNCILRVHRTLHKSHLPSNSYFTANC